jgi:hypothetical protein
MPDEISRDFSPSFTYYNDCSAAFGQELQSSVRAGLATNLCAKPNLEREKIDLQVHETGGIEIEPFIAVGMGHSEVEPARFGMKGLIEEVADKRFEAAQKNAPVTFHEKAEWEGNLGVIIRY